MSKSPKLNILVAYPYFHKTIFELLDKQDPSSFRLIVDSGAFTAWNTGRTIELDDYCRFLKNIPRHWDYKAVQLDVFGNPEGTYINYQKMLDRGFTDIMPVFTRGDSLERLEEFYSHTDYIMFGGIVIGGENKNYVRWFLDVNKGRHCHWLGFVNMPFIKHYKPFSVDSSSLYSAQRYGNMQYYAGGGDLKSIHKTELKKLKPTEVCNLLRRSGFNAEEIGLLAHQSAWQGGAQPPDKNNVKGLSSFITVTNHVKRSIEVEKNLGTRIFLAFTSAETIKNGYDAIRFMQSRNAL